MIVFILLEKQLKQDIHLKVDYVQMIVNLPFILIHIDQLIIFHLIQKLIYPKPM